MSDEAREARDTLLLDTYFAARGDGTKGRDILNAVRAVDAAGIAEGKRLAAEEITNRIDAHHGPGVASVERAIVRAYAGEPE